MTDNQTTENQGQARINHDRIRLLSDLRDMLTGAVFVMPNFVSCELEADARRIEEVFK